MIQLQSIRSSPLSPGCIAQGSKNFKAIAHFLKEHSEGKSFM